MRASFTVANSSAFPAACAPNGDSPSAKATTPVARAEPEKKSLLLLLLSIAETTSAGEPASDDTIRGEKDGERRRDDEPVNPSAPAARRENRTTRSMVAGSGDLKGSVVSPVTEVHKNTDKFLLFFQ